MKLLTSVFETHSDSKYSSSRNFKSIPTLASRVTNCIRIFQLQRKHLVILFLIKLV